MRWRVAMGEISRRAFIAGGSGAGAFAILAGAGVVGGLGLVSADIAAAGADPVPNELKVWLWGRAGATAAYPGPIGATWMGAVPLSASYPSGTGIGYLGVA